MKLVKSKPKPVVLANAPTWMLEKAAGSDLLCISKRRDELAAIHEELLRRKAAGSLVELRRAA